MKQVILSFFVLVLIILPLSNVSAATDPGVKPSSFFYVFDTLFERLDLLFTFSAEKKANKALEYAEERLSEAKEEADANKPEGVEEAMKSYETSMSLATEKSKELKNESETETLLNTISLNTLKHQEVLRSVYDQVPEEAKEAILKAIEISHNRQEEADRQIGLLKKEVAQLQDEIGELQKKLEEKNAEQKPSPTPSQKQGNEIKKSTQTPVPPTVTPISDKSLKELKEELERKLKELEKTPTPTPTITPTPTHTLSPTLTPVNYTSTPIPTPTPTPQTTLLPTTTPSLTPTPIPLVMKVKEFIYNSQDSIFLSQETNEIKSITFEVYSVQYPNVAGVPDPIYGTETKEGLPGAWEIYVFLDGNGGRIFEDVLVTSNPMTVPISKTFRTKNRIGYGIACRRDDAGQCMSEPNLAFKIISVDGATIERN